MNVPARRKPTNRSRVLLAHAQKRAEDLHKCSFMGQGVNVRGVHVIAGVNMRQGMANARRKCRHQFLTCINFQV